MTAYLVLSALLFGIGVFGAITRRNVISVLMAVELMFNAANLNLVAASRLLYPGAPVGQVLAVFSIAIAAAEAAVGLALILAIYRKFDTVLVERFNLLKG